MMVSLLATVRGWLLLFTIAALPLTFARGFAFDIYNLPKLTFLFVSVSIAIGLRAAECLVTRLEPELGGAWKPALAMAAPLAVAWIFGAYRGWSLIGQYSRYAGLLPYLATICLGLLIADAFAGRPARVAWAFLVGASGVGAYGIVQMLFLGARIGVESDTSLVTSTLGQSNFAGGFLAIALPIALTLWIKSPNRRISVAAAAATTLITLGLLFTFSQGAWAAASAGVAVVLGWVARDRIAVAPKLAVAGVAVIVTVTVGVVVATMFVPHAYDRAPDSLKSTVTRGFIWKTALTVAADSPIVGVGPNTFAIEGPLHRSREEAILLNSVKNDDPHSVPLAMLANGGLLMLTGYALAIIWGVKTFIRYPRDVHAIAFGGALIAYVVQALVSIDEPSLRFAFWVILAGLAAGPIRIARRPEARPSRGRLLAAVLVVGASLVPSIFAVTTLLVADAHVRLAAVAIGERDVSRASREFRAAIELRSDPEYKRLYGGFIGDTGVILGPPEGGALIDEMRQAFAYLESFPDAQALDLEGWVLFQWSHYEPDSARDALGVLKRAQELDPNSPVTAVFAADSLIHLGNYDAAAAELDPYARVLQEEFPEYAHLYSDVFADLAIAHAKSGRPEEARRALDLVAAPGKCRPQVAQAILRGVTTLPTELGFICPPALLDVIES